MNAPSEIETHLQEKFRVQNLTPDLTPTGEERRPLVSGTKRVESK